MVDNLPNEVLAKISTNVSRNDLCTCTRVCRSWNRVLTPALYGVVNIGSQHQFEQFYETLRQTDQRNSLGHLVRELAIWPDTDRDKFKSLPSLCPFVVDIDFKKFWAPWCAAVLTEWEYLAKVPRLSLNRSPDFPLSFFRERVSQLKLDIYKYPGWIGLVEEFPLLERLAINGDSDDNTHNITKISVSELEVLHNSLSHLSSLSLRHLSIDGEISEAIPLCDTMRELTLDLLDDPLWYQYFAEKYGKLEMLFIYGLENLNEAAKAKTSALARSCRHLKRFEYIRGVGDGDSCSFHRSLLEIFQEIGAPIDYLQLKNWDVPSYITTVNSFCGTLSLLVFSSMDKIMIDEVLEPLKACSHLVELCLQCDENEIEMNRVLSCCMSLETLMVNATTIGRGKTNAMEIKHKLKTLTMIGEDIEDAVYPYLSKRCSRLSDLKCMYTGDSNRNPTINLSNMSLESLQVYCSNSPAFKVQLTSERTEVLEERKSYHGPADEHKINGSTRWYRQFIVDGLPCLRQLNSQEVDKILGQIDGNTSRSTKRQQEEEMIAYLSNSTDEISIISIKCSSVDKILLQWTNLRTIN